MTVFSYAGRNHNGEQVSGALDASSAELAAQQLLSGGIYPTSIQQQKADRDEEGISFSIGRKVKADELIILTRQLYSLTKAGVPLNSSIRGLANTLKNAYLVKVLKDIEKNLNSGITLSTAMSRHVEVFPRLYDMATFEKKRILVVGGAGFVGSNLCHKLVDQEPAELIIVDNLLSSDPANLPDHPAVEFRFGSIADDRVLRDLPDDLDYVFHLACYHGNQSSMHDPIADHDNNTLTTLKLFERLKDQKSLKKVVYAAAGCAVAEKTYGEAAATAEDAPVSLYHDSPYSISKLIGEMYGNYYWRQHDLPFVKARFQNVYGPREILGAGRWRGTVHTVWRNVTPVFIFKSLMGEALPLDNGGQTSRDFIFVEDMARGLMAAALKGEPGEIYNLASGRETTIRNLAETINRLTGNITPVDLRPARDWDRSGRRFGDPTKAKEQLGFEAETAIEDGLAATVAWTKANLDTIRHCMAQHRSFMPELTPYIDEVEKSNGPPATGVAA